MPSNLPRKDPHVHVNAGSLSENWGPAVFRLPAQREACPGRGVEHCPVGNCGKNCAGAVEGPRGGGSAVFVRARTVRRATSAWARWWIRWVAGVVEVGGAVGAQMGVKVR